MLSGAEDISQYKNLYIMFVLFEAFIHRHALDKGTFIIITVILDYTYNWRYIHINRNI
jgi:hypothetical protein